MTGSQPRDGAMPEVTQAQCAPDEQESAAITDGKPKSKTILLAEDQPAIQLLMAQFLKQNGFHVLPASDGREALELAHGYDGRIDLLLSDVMMPGMDGPTLAHALKATRPEMKTLLMSGDPERLLPALGESKLEAGVLQKPFGLPKLLEKVHEMTCHTNGAVIGQGSGCQTSTRPRGQSIEADS